MPRCCTCMYCCQAFRPRYKRLVDGIYPTDRNQDGIDRNNMQKLTYFALSHPQKLDRIGQYLERLMTRDIYRRRITNVHVAMQALDELLMACHSQSLNLFVESFLRMVQKLLECPEFDLQELATNSFVKFSNIEEDTASYHRRYDFFVSKFSSMCHSGLDDPLSRISMRLAGLRGIQSVVRKTVSDDLQVNIWEPSHMDKIVPSLLYNMQKSEDSGDDVDGGVLSRESGEDGGNEVPSELAESCLRDLVCRAAYGNIKSVIRPALKHLDLHKLWVPNEFAVRCFKIIMYSVHAQYALMVIELLQKHLDEHSSYNAQIKTSIVTVLSEVVTIAAQGSIGPSVLDFFNTMLRHLKQSIASKPKNDDVALSERQFQEAVISLCGEFASNLPDFMKIDICMFIMSNMPVMYDNRDALCTDEDKLIQNMLLRCILRVATEYKTVHLVAAFPTPFLTPLLKLSIVSDPEVRLVVLKIFHSLFDRHSNLQKLTKPKIADDFEELGLTTEKCSRQDALFMKKNQAEILSHLHTYALYDNNTAENFTALYSILVILHIETCSGSEDVGIEMIRLVLAIQELLVSKDSSVAHLQDSHKCALHAIIAAYLDIASHLFTLQAFQDHVKQVIDKRKSDMPELLPESVFTSAFESLHYLVENVTDELLFSKVNISDVLKDADIESGRLSLPFIGRSVVDGDSRSRTGSDGARSLSQIEIDSINSFPAAVGPHRVTPRDPVTARKLKDIINKDSLTYKQRAEREEKYRREVAQMFHTAPFQDLKTFISKHTDYSDNKLEELLQRIKVDSVRGDSDAVQVAPAAVDNTNMPVTVFEMKYPDLFVF